MRTIYIDFNNHCHAEDIGGCTPVETDFFDGKCREFIEGYCYDDSNGIAIYPWHDYAQLNAIQNAVDRTQGQADKQIMELLDVIEELIIGG